MTQIELTSSPPAHEVDVVPIEHPFVEFLHMYVRNFAAVVDS